MNGEYNNAGNASIQSTVLENGYRIINTTSGSLVTYKRANLKNNTTYTLICDINSNMETIGFSFKSGNNYGQGLYYEDVDYSNGYTRIAKTITTTTNCTDVVIGYHGYTPVGTYLNIKNLMLFEGDITSDYPTDYFDENKSSFENNLVTQDMIDLGQEKKENLGKYKAQYKVASKDKEVINTLYLNSPLLEGDTLESIDGRVCHMRNGTLYELVEGNLSINLFEGDNQVSSISNVPATIEIEVDRVINRAIEAVEFARLNPTVENLSRARMWTDLIKD